MAAAFLLLGMANNALDVSFNSLYYKDEKTMDQNRKYGIYVFWIGLGPAVGVFGGGLLMKLADFRVLLAVFAAIMLLVLSRRPAASTTRNSTWFRSGITGRNILRQKTLLFVVFVFVLALHWSVEGTVYSPFPRRSRSA